MKSIGFIGLGFMGRGMAANLLRGVDRLVVYDVSAANSCLFEKIVNENKQQQEKLIVVKSIEEVAQQTQTICLSLPSEDSCHEVIFGSKGISKKWQMKDGKKLIIDHGTFSQAFAKQTASNLLTNYERIDYMDAPVSGGPLGAKNGTLTIMTGGKKELFDENQFIFHSIGKNVLYFGETGKLSLFVFDCLI